MAKTKTKNTKSNAPAEANNQPAKGRRRKRTKLSYFLHEGLGITLCLLAVFSGISVFAADWSGTLGQAFHSFLQGLFGVTSFFVPIFLLVAGIALIAVRKNGDLFAIKWVVAVFVHWFVAAIISAAVLGNQYSSYSVGMAFRELYKLAIAGGAFGGVLAVPLVRLVHVPFAILLLAVFAAVGIMVVTEVTPADIWYVIKVIGRGIGKFFAAVAKAIKHLRQHSRNNAEIRRNERKLRENQGPTFNGKSEYEFGEDVVKREKITFDGVNRKEEQYGSSASKKKFHVPDLGDEPIVNEDKQDSPYSFDPDDQEVMHTYTGSKPQTAAPETESADKAAVKVEPDEQVAEAEPREEVEPKQDGTDEVEMLDVSSLRTTGSAEKPAAGENITFVVADQPVEAIKVKRRHTGSNYVKPDVNLLKAPAANAARDMEAARKEAMQQAKTLETTLANFGVAATVKNITRGPAVTRFELTPNQGVRVNKITSLADDIALNLAAGGIRIEAPIPGKAAVGIEIPNKHVDNVMLREGLESEVFNNNSSSLAVVLGKSITGDIVVSDLAKMPHLLIAGATGSGKSVCINCIIMSLLYKSSPDQVKLIMIDPKVVELGVYNGIPHLMVPVVTDPKKAAGALGWAVNEMERRYASFSEKGVRDLAGYNEIMKRKRDPEALMPKIVIIIDELADLMMVAPTGVEDAICRLAQKARAAGIYLIVATQRPSVDVITGIIKANITSRIAFAVKSQVDSRTILDMAGAEKLLGRGDMLYYPIGEQKPIRVKGAFVSDQEVEDVVDYLKANYDDEYDDTIQDQIDCSGSEGSGDGEDYDDDTDEFLEKAIELAVEAQTISVSYLQRRLKVGHSRAGRIIDQMEDRGIIGPAEGSKPRQVRISPSEWMEMKAKM